MTRTMRTVMVVMPIALVVALSGIAATASGAAQPTAGATHAVGATTERIVDRHRPTAANGKCPRLSSRTLATSVFYPATGDPGASAPASDAAPDRSGGPYPLIVFSHGYSADPEVYGALLAHWAAAGYVVAAPEFPLTGTHSPCGAIAGDVVNQPEDVSAVIDFMVRASARRGGRLGGMVDAHAIGVAGHSNGGITTYGVAANTAVRDPRVKAAEILAGTAEKYPKGRYDFANAPPLLFVHGSEDELIPYEDGVAGFNRARGPKALLTVTGGNHGSSAALSDPAAEPTVLQATTDFFDAYLRDDAAARRRLPDDQVAGVATMQVAAKEGSTTTIPTLARPVLHLRASATPTKNLKGGQTVTVTWSGYSAGKVINILQCSGGDKDLTNSAACDFTKAYLLQPDPSGAGSTGLEIVEGAVGTGTCDAEHQGCFIVVNNASATDRASSRVIPITFAN